MNRLEIAIALVAFAVLLLAVAGLAEPRDVGVYTPPRLELPDR